MPHQPPPFLTIAYTALALLSFAANSVLCRLALQDLSIDAASFTIVRLLAGTITLLLILGTQKLVFSAPTNKQARTKGSWLGGALLFIYAIAFSYGYISLNTGTGALILFGSVQITIIVFSLLSGSRLNPAEWLGMLVAFSGFLYLILPDIQTPSTTGFVLMTGAGVAWGAYTIIGRSSNDPLSDTAYNFVRTTPFLVVVACMTIWSGHYSKNGLILAMLSGAGASGIGYAIWYSALRGLSSTQAGVTQLLVPALAAIGGVFFANEILTARIIGAGVMIIGGVFLVVLGQHITSIRAK